MTTSLVTLYLVTLATLFALSAIGYLLNETPTRMTSINAAFNTAMCGWTLFLLFKGG